jgi:MSHA biogenesis protein MshK
MKGMVLCVLALAFGPAEAQTLRDPMRPPGASAPADAGAEAQGGEGQGASVRLQSILLSPGRKFAVINGQEVRLGGRVGDATLIAISETGVVLKRGDERQSVQLLPGVEKKPPAGAAVRRNKQGRQE